jgi:hypothetical protein
VLNPIALDVPEEVFRATHHPSLVQQHGIAPGSVVLVEEGQVVDDFLSEAETHGFTAAVGDTGTGKSHFIRWLYLEVLRRTEAEHAPRHVVMIPRSAANLADVVRQILQDFEGEATDRLRAEVEKHRGLREPEARQRVLDELAIAVGSVSPSEDEDDEAEYLREVLPAFLRDDAVRRALTEEQDSIVPRLARHVLGQRETAEPENLRWDDSDLLLPAQAITRAGADASELASSFLNDDRLRDGASQILQRAQGPAIAALLRFRSGDLKRALNEIRAQLAERGCELILLLEDLSITEGLDAELLEALQIRTIDTGQRLCTLRSIVGLTRDDYQRLRDNIKARLSCTLWFDAPIGQGTTDSENAELSVFSARYLNAVRLEGEELTEWAKGPPGAQPRSACEECPNRSDCHAAFGAVDGFGLYPFTPVALGRLYRLVVRPDGHQLGFKPRSLLKVLSDMLGEAERGISRAEFPNAQMIQSFGLGRTTADLQLALRSKLGEEGDRVLRAYELYADQPAVARPQIPRGVAAALGLELPAWSGTGKKRLPEDAPEPEEHSPRPTLPALDVYDQWLRGGTPADRSVNAWRQAIFGAVQAAIDWDVERIAPYRSVLRARDIRIEGQKTRTVDPVLVVSRSPECAVTLRVLSEAGERQDKEAALRTARIRIDAWADKVRAKIAEKAATSPDRVPLNVGIQLLAVGVFVRGSTPHVGKEGPLLAECLRQGWSDGLRVGRGSAWVELIRAYDNLGGKVQTRIHHSLSCTKGGQAGSFLDPSSVLQTLREVRRGDLPEFRYDEADDWETFRDVGRLASKVAQHLPLAMEEEIRACEEWREALGQLLGEDSPADVVAWITEALEAATEIGHGHRGLRRSVGELQGRAVKGCLDGVDKVLSAADQVSRLIAIGSLDRSLMKQFRDTAELAHQVLSEVEDRVAQQVHDAHGGASADELLAEVQQHLELIHDAYSELLGEEVENG